MTIINTYTKFCANVFVAKCQEQHEKGEIIELTTKYGKTNTCVVFNLVKQQGGFYYYSIVRADGFDYRAYCERKADKYQSYADNAINRSNVYYEKSQEARDFRSLCEPIKIGHHSERAHRALYERVHNAMGKSIAESDKAEQYEHKKSYWEAKSSKINLSMPECISYYDFKLEEAQKYHAGLKDGTIAREHCFSMQYAKKAVNEAEKNRNMAVLLWG